MEWYLIFIALFSFAIFLASTYGIWFSKPYSLARDIFITVASFAIFMLCAICTHVPQAIHVYEGKTTLEITYRNGIAVDTVVVFKDNDCL